MKDVDVIRDIENLEKELINLYKKYNHILSVCNKKDFIIKNNWRCHNCKLHCQFDVCILEEMKDWYEYGFRD